MTAEVSNGSVNGTYGSHPSYGGVDSAQNFGAYASTAPSTQSASHAGSSTTTGTTAAAESDVPKDEVGWYFVEQYYTTLSKHPDRLYLFYNKRSQFVSGQETDKVAVCVGQRSINDKIKELDFHDCKVRVTNVDSQASDTNIVIQVIGELSNRQQPHKKFTQTFVLAEQTNGYFVLNDIFRYLIEEEDEEVPPTAEEPAQAAGLIVEGSGVKETASVVVEAEPKTLTSSADPAEVEEDARQVDQGLEEKVLNASKPEEDIPPQVNGVDAHESPAETDAAPVAVPSTTADDTANETLKPEKPKDPEPTPVASPPKQTATQPAAVPKAAIPKTWASLAASANKSAVPAPPATPTTAAAPATAAQPKPVAVAPKAPASVAASETAAPKANSGARRDPSPTLPKEQDEWTPVSGAHNRQQSRQVNPTQPETPQYRGYIKNVHEGVDGAQLRAAIEKNAEIIYFDVARQKNCAFVDFKTAEDYNAAIGANPYVISGEQLFVVERIVRPGSTPFVHRGGYQGGRGRGGNNTGAPRGNFQQGGRGGFAPRGRGGSSATRGRGAGPQAA